MPRALESPRRADVVEIADVIVDFGEIEHPAQAAQRHAQPVRSAESAELPATFDVRFQIEKHARECRGASIAA